MVGPQPGSSRVPRAKFFSKVVPRPLGMGLKQMFFARFEPVVAKFDPWEIPNTLKTGRFGTKKRPKTHFFKINLGSFWVNK